MTVPRAAAPIEVSAAEPDRRRAEPKSARTRARVLDAAAELLSAHGYAGTRLSDVARAAGLQASALYYYFESREALVEQVLVTGATRMLERVTGALDALPDDADPVTRLGVAVEAHLRHALDLTAYATATIRIVEQVPEEVRTGARPALSSYRRLWRELVTAADPSPPDAPGIDPHVSLMLILGALNWAVEWWRDDRADLDTLIDTARTMVCRALGHP